MALTNLATGTLLSPTQQRFTSGSGTYTLPAGCLYIRVRAVGGGSGGGGSGAAGTAGNSVAGGNTTFGSSLIVANGGSATTSNGGVAGAGGTASLGSGPIGIALQGGTGNSGNRTSDTTATNLRPSGGTGAASPFGGAGGGGSDIGGPNGFSAIANTGSGGGGASTAASGGTTNTTGGAGGSAGGYVEAFIFNPSATYAYSVGGSGGGGSNGTGGNTGGAGGSGYIVVDEYYQFSASSSSGSGGSGVGAKNYIATVTTSNGNNALSGNFESGSVTSFTLAHSTLSSVTPTSTASAGTAFSSSNGGTSANGNLSFSLISSGQIAGTFSASLASSTASTAGDMLISNPWFIDSEDKAKMMTIKFYYNVNSGAANLNLSGSSSNTHAVWIYDVTNGAWIQPAGVYNLVQNSGTGYCTATFQTTSNSTQYQLALININASGGAFALYLDDIQVGPQTAPTGVPMTDWSNNYTFTSNGWGTIANIKISSRRVGNSLQVKGYFSSGTPAASSAAILLPSGLSIDGSSFTTNAAQAVGGIYVQTASATPGNINTTNAGQVVLFYDGADTSRVYVAFQSANSDFQKVNGSTLNNASDGLSFYFEVPITGWSSNTNVSSDTDTRVVAFYVSPALPTGTLTSSYNTTSFGAANTDTHGAWNGTNTYTIPVSGFYDLSAAISLSSASASQAFEGVQFLVNGSTAIGQSVIRNSATASHSVVTNLQAYKFNAGDTVVVQAQSASGTPAFVSGTGINWFSINRVSGPAVVAATETVAMNYTSNNSPSITNSYSLITFNGKVIDTHGAYSSGLFTAPVSGKYSISFTATSGTVSSNGTQNFQAEIRKNGSAVYDTYFPTYTTVSTNTAPVVSGFFIAQLNAGDTIGLYLLNTNSTTLISSATSNQFNIYRFGN